MGPKTRQKYLDRPEVGLRAMPQRLGVFFFEKLEVLVPGLSFFRLWDKSTDQYVYVLTICQYTTLFSTSEWEVIT